MTAIARITDHSEISLAARVARLMAGLKGEPVVVDHFTYWYTSRAPVHEALVLSVKQTPAPGSDAPPIR